MKKRNSYGRLIGVLIAAAIGVAAYAAPSFAGAVPVTGKWAQQVAGDANAGLLIEVGDGGKGKHRRHHDHHNVYNYYDDDEDHIIVVERPRYVTVYRDRYVMVRPHRHERHVLVSCDPHAFDPALVGGIFGGATGGILGAAVGRGGDKTAATIGGTIAGVLIGAELGRSADYRCIAYDDD